MADKPMCPYCGKHNGYPDGVEMDIIHLCNGHFRYRCPKCKSLSPERSSKALAIRDANRRFRSMQKPLTLEEIKALPKPSDFDEPPFFWVEIREHILLTLHSHWFHISALLEACGVTISKWQSPLSKYKYGVDFIAWRSRPTAEERAAAKCGT